MTLKTAFDFKEYLATRRQLVESRLATYLAFEDGFSLYESMRYSVLSGGKRLRALLCLASFEAASQEFAHNKSLEEALNPALPCACAIELVHAMSLIHDDLPCMDNDDLRRGKPTNHKVFGDAMALLAGDALLAYASEVLIQYSSCAPARLNQIALELVKAVGGRGMVGGQVIDIALTGSGSSPNKSDKCASQTKIDRHLLESMHARKTGALISFSTWSGAALAGATDEDLKAYRRFGEILGLAFQIKDDLLDITGDKQTLGKTPGKDAACKKLTFIELLGKEESEAELERLKKEAELTIKNFASAPQLSALLDLAITRNN